MSLSSKQVEPQGTSSVASQATLSWVTRVQGLLSKGGVVWLVGLPVVAFLISMTLGRYPISLGQLLTLLAAKLHLSDAPIAQSVDTVIFGVRLPRVLAAMLIGGGLSAAGASYQGLFRNPLVSPDILGASAGAGFGAALGIMLAKSIVATELLGVAFGLGAVLSTYFIAGRLKRGDPILFLVLAGILIGTVFNSLISLLKYLADPNDKLPAITFWLMGSLASIDRKDLLLLMGPIVVGMVALFSIRWHLNPLSFGEEEARSMGAETGKLRVIIIGACTLITASAVSVAGIIGWVGLVIPHLARGLVGPDYSKLLPVSAVIGAVYLLVVDDVARLAGPLELPIGILTALVGAPVFLLLLARTRRAWA